MKNESSPASAFRAMVMLACLVLIPVAALWGGGLSDLLKQLLQQHLGLNTASAAASASVAPPFVAWNQNPPAAAASNPQAMPGLAPPTVQFPSPGTLPQGAACGPGPAPGAAPLSPVAVAIPGLLAASSVPSAPQTAAGMLPRAGETAIYQRNAAEVVPASFSAPVFAPVETPASPAALEGLQQVQQRLRQLGSTYSLLESWGPQGELFRFYCRIAVDGNPNYTRYFEAVDSDAPRVINRVLSEVEAWRAGRL